MKVRSDKGIFARLHFSSNIFGLSKLISLNFVIGDILFTIIPSCINCRNSVELLRLEESIVNELYFKLSKLFFKHRIKIGKNILRAKYWLCSDGLPNSLP
jgi:hypothetical protein